MAKTQKKLYVWMERATEDFVVMKSKIAWVSSGAAKNAFDLHMQNEDFAVKLREASKKSSWTTVDQLWAKQDKYDLVEIYGLDVSR